MKNRMTTAIVIFIVLSTVLFAGCGAKPETSQKQIEEVKRGDLPLKIYADGNLDMPHDVHLKFGTPGTVKQIFVVEGQKVREGALLAKLDDTTQKLAIASAQYNVELATNQLLEKIHPALMGLPENYPDTSTVLRVEQAQEELRNAQKFLGQDKYQDAAAELRLAVHDLQATYDMFNIPEIAAARYGVDPLLGTAVDNYPDITAAIERLQQDLTELANIQALIEQGDYEQAKAALTAEQNILIETYNLVKSLSGRIRVSQRVCGSSIPGYEYLFTQWMWVSGDPSSPIPGHLVPVTVSTLQFTDKWSQPTGLLPIYYPDTSTSLDWLKQVEENLLKIQLCKETEGCDELELATLLRMAQHDVDMSRTILENNEMIFRAGVNLQALRSANLNIQLAESNLKSAKDALMKTEILAPFDGTVVDVGVKENDQLSSFDYSSKTAVYLIDTRTVKMEGVVDEVDIYRVKVGQEAFLTVDALPGEELTGKVTFISPFGNQTTGVVEFPVTITLDPTETELKGGLTATANIIIEKRENVLLVPNRSIKGSAGNYYVDLVRDEKTMATEKRPVEIGAQNEQFTEIVSGLSEGDKVVVEPTRSRTATSF